AAAIAVSTPAKSNPPCQPRQGSIRPPWRGCRLCTAGVQLDSRRPPLPPGTSPPGRRNFTSVRGLRRHSGAATPPPSLARRLLSRAHREPEQVVRGGPGLPDPSGREPPPSADPRRSAAAAGPVLGGGVRRRRLLPGVHGQ